MALRMKNIQIKARLPKLPRSVNVYKTKPVTMDDRKTAISMIRRKLNLAKTRQVEVKESIYFVAETGVLQFYRPSGAIWAHNEASNASYKDEQRPWKTEKAPDQNDPDNYDLVLTPAETKSLKSSTVALFKELGLHARGAYFADIQLDQVTQLGEKGEEAGRFPGEATARVLYKIDDIDVDGPGAKSYVFYNPGKRTAAMSGLYHCWRNIASPKEIKIGSIESSLDISLTKDPELEFYHGKKHKITLTSVDLIYMALPPDMFQDYLFPAFRVVGHVTPPDDRQKSRSFEFARFFHAISPEQYLKVDILSHHLGTRL